MTFRTLTLVDAVYVASNMRQVDRDCVECVTTITSPEFFALNRWQTDGAAWSMGDVPICMGGISMAVPWIGTVWLVCTDAMSTDSWKKLLRWGRRILANAAQTFARLECHVLSTWGEAERFARRMGFVLEGTRKRAGRDGQDILTFVFEGTP